MGSESGVGVGARVRAGAVAVTVALALVSLAGCSSSEPDVSPAPAPSTTRTPSPADPTSTTTASTPSPTRYRPDPAEVDGAAKRSAAREVEALPDVRQVTYTQYLGYLPPVASILVEADLVDGGGTTYDVRIGQVGGRWRVESVTPAAPVPPLEDPSRLVWRVLDNDRITLPWAGRADVAGGVVSDAVLRSMLAVAEQHRIVVSVLVAAHPVNVFGTDRRSNHPDGDAYDLGSIDGRLVVDPANARRVEQVMRLAASTGAYQVGCPVQLDCSQYFSDLTHSDHVHVVFDG